MSNNRCVFTNELKCIFNDKNIKRDFDIFSISVNNEENHTGAKLLDISDSVKALSVLYKYGTKMYCMYKKDDVNEQGLELLIKENCSIDVTVKKINPVDSSSHQILEVDLMQLLCNSLMNDIKESYNNLSGKLYYLKSDSVYSRDNKVSRISVLEFDFSQSKKYDTVYNIQIKSITFNRLDKALHSCKRKKEREVLLKKPKYIFDENGNFKRLLKSEYIPDDCKFVEKSIKKIDCDFIRLNSVDEFSNTKMGALYQFLEDVKMYLSDYLSFEFKKVDKIKVVNKVSDNVVNKKEKEYFKKIDDTGVVLVNKVDDDSRIESVIDDVIEGLHNNYVTNISFKDDIEEDKFNVIFIHDKDYYFNNNLPDKHIPIVCGQHIVLEKYISKDKDDKIKNVSSSVIKKILYELLIKEDIKNGKISLFNLDKLEDDLFYAIHQYYGTNDNKKSMYHILKISCLSEISYLTVSEFENKELFNKLDEYRIKFTNKYLRHSDLEMFVFNDNEATALIHNNLFTIPDINEIYYLLNNYAPNKSIPAIELEKYLREFCDDNPKYKEKMDNIISIIRQSQKKNYTYQEITNGKPNELEPLMSIRDKLTIDFLKYCRNKYGIVFNPLLKNEINENVVKSASTKINIYQNNIDPLDNRFWYFVGSKGSLNKYGKAVHIRCLESFEGDNHLKDILLSQLNVDFVRLGEYTVHPFPYKYLKEYISFNKEKFVEKYDTKEKNED